MSRRLSRLLSYVADTPWAMHHPSALRMLAIIERRVAGKRLEQAQIDDATLVDRDAYASRREAAAIASKRNGGMVAVVPVYGTILGRDWEFTNASHGGTTSAEGLARSLRILDRDDRVGTVILDIDSPGGSVANLPETAAVIAGMSTHVVAQVNSLAASAAYWLASQADEIVATPSAEVGSIGVYTMHVDEREALAQEGVTVEIIRAGENKIASNPFEELTPEARADIQDGVDKFHAMFVGAVAKGRGVSSSAVVEKFGDGKVFLAADALKRGMVDRIATLDETIGRAASGKKTRRRAAAVQTVFVNNTVDGDIAIVDATATAHDLEGNPIDVAAVVADDLADRVKADLALRKRRIDLL